MYIYRRGAIGDAIHAKIEAAKQNVKTGGRAGNDQSFRDTLKAYMYQSESGGKPVTSAVKGSGRTSANGSALIYAMQNGDTDATASAVLDSLGYTKGSASKSLIKSAADELSASAAALSTAAENGTDETKTIALADFAEKFNTLSSRLGAASTTSAHLYRTSLTSYIREDALEGTGLELDRSGKLAVSGKEIDLEKLSPIISGVSAVAKNASVYSETIAGTGSSTGGIDGSSALSAYYSSLINLM